MYAYINGTVADVYPDLVVLDVNDIGYNVHISGKTASQLPLPGQKVKLYTYTSVREDAIELLGFMTRDDLNVFKDLISVSGVGPKSALNLLSVMDADSIRVAIVTGDVKGLSKAPGLGKKSAERIIVDLKSKYGNTEVKNASAGFMTAPQDSLDNSGFSPNFVEAAEALMALGFGRNEIVGTMKNLGLDDNADVDLIISETLKMIR